MLRRSGSRLARLFRRGQQIFHFVVALTFLFLTVAGVSVSIKLWNQYRTLPGEGFESFGLVACFTVVLLIFCLYSFLKARSVR